MKRELIFAAAAAVMAAGCSQKQTTVDSQEPAELLMFTGSYAPADSAGIKSYVFNQADGSWRKLGEASGVSNPSYIAVDEADRRIYSVGEDEGLSSTINMLTYNADGSEIELRATELTGGGAPCFVTITPDGMKAVTANYMGGSISVFDLDSAGCPLPQPELIAFEGSGPDPARQTQPHLHQTIFNPSTGTMLANDLGRDRIYLIPAPYTGDGMSEIAIEPGPGPRHTTFSPSGSHAYMLSEISGKISVFDVEADSLTLVQTIASDSVGGEGSADIHLSPDGRFLYSSNRLKDDGIAIFTVDSASGLLQRVGYQLTGSHPRNFAITPNGRYLLAACRDANAIEIYERDSQTGLLSLVGTIAAPKPTCIVFAAVE